MFNAKKISAAALACILITLLSSGAFAAVASYLPYPSADPVIINPYGENDESAQLLGAMLPIYRVVYGRSFQIEEQPGRGGATGWGALVDKEGDGYSLAFINLQSLLLRGMASRPVYKLDEIVTTNIMAEAPLVLWVPENSPFPNLTELVRSAKAYPNQLIISGAGSSTQTHLLTLRLNFLAGIKTIYLPYIGSGMAMASTKLGQSHAAWGLPLPEYGKKYGMRPLAVTAPKRLANMPDVPTFEEANIALFENAHFGLALPAAAAAGTRQAVTAHFGKIIGEKDFQDSIAKLGFTPRAMEAQELNDLIKSESERLSELLEQFNME